MNNTSRSKYIKEKRIQLGYSKEKLAELMDVSVRTISDVENGKYNISDVLMRNVEEALDVAFIIDRDSVCEHIDSAIKAMEGPRDKLEEYKEFRAIIRQLYSMGREDIHKTYDFINSLHGNKR